MAYSCGYNIRWLLRAIVRLGPKLVFLRLLMLAVIAPLRVNSSYVWRLAALAHLSPTV